MNDWIEATCVIARHFVDGGHTLPACRDGSHRNSAQHHAIRFGVLTARSWRPAN